jgi:hypothetical protein
MEADCCIEGAYGRGVRGGELWPCRACLAKVAFAREGHVHRTARSLGVDAARGSISPSRDGGGEATSSLPSMCTIRPRGIMGEAEALAPSCGQSLLVKPQST